MKVNIEALNQAFFREWDISLGPGITDYPDELVAIIKLLEYSMKDISSYDRLTPKWKVISKELFKKIMLTPEQNQHRVVKEKTRNAILQLLSDAQTEGLETTDLQIIISEINQYIQKQK